MSTELSTASNYLAPVTALRCFTTNVRSIMNKLPEFNLFVDCHSPDIIALCETWLSEKVPNSILIGLHPYTAFRCDRSNRRAGGVCLFVKEDRKLKVQQVVLPSEFNCLEIIAIDLTVSSLVLPYRVIVAYRPPDYSSESNTLFFSALDYLASNTGRVCLLGDLNLPDFEWELFLHPDSLLYNSAADLICNHGLTQLVDEPTRGDNILDVVLCSDVLSCDDIGYLPPLGSSDHSIVSFTLTLSFHNVAENYPRPSCPNYNLADWASLSLYFGNIDWAGEFSCCTSASDMWSKFTDVIQAGVSNYVPNYRSPHYSRTHHHYPTRIRRLYIKKLQSWRLYRTFRTGELLDKYKRLSKAFSSSFNHFQCQFENELVNSDNLGMFYKYVNKKLNGSNGVAPLRDADGNLVATDCDKAAVLNNQFCSVFTVDDGIIDSSRLPGPAVSSVAPPFFTPELVHKIIKQLKSSNASGPDGLPAIFYKNTASSLSYPLSILFNLSLQTADIPPIWKLASVTPIFKKGSPSDPSNYRPISITCISSKLMEVGIKEHLLNHMKNSGALSNAQHGFMTSKSTTTHLLECCSDWNLALRSRKAVDVIYLDFAKAFDSVVHSKLLAKLNSYGINNMVLKWIESFLTDRSQYVRIGFSLSSVCSVLSGVPQGSVLGPVLFIIYVNDITKLWPFNTVSIKMFADDTKLYTVLHDDSAFSTDLQSCLDSIIHWSAVWQLKLAPTKCTVMRIKSIKSHSFTCVPFYHIGSVQLPVIENCTDLGVSYNANLSFSPHVNKIVTKASCRAKLILKCFSSRDPLLLMRAFCTFVRPLLEFSSTIWSPYTVSDINRIESVQRSFTKHFHYLRYSTYRERLVNLGLDSLQCRRVKADLVLCYKLLHGLTNIKSDDFIVLSPNVNLRGNQFKLVKPMITSARDKNFFCNRVINIWNSLPDYIVMADTIACFKHRLNCFDFSDYVKF